MTDLTPFKVARRLEWRPLTVWVPHRGDDGNLIADGVLSLELDTWLPDTGWAGHCLTSEGVGIAVVDPATPTDRHNAIRAWCRKHLGRDDIAFPEVVA